MPRQTWVDVHAHFVTDEYAAAAQDAGVTRPDGMPGWPRWSLADHIAMMENNRIERAVLSVSSPGVHFGDDDAAVRLACQVNDYASTLVCEYRDRFDFLASLPLPCIDAAVAETIRALDSLRAAGVIVMSNSAGRYLGDEALHPLWEQLNLRQAVVFVHPTSPPNADVVALQRPSPMIEFMFETTRTVTDMVFADIPARYPDIRFVVPHCGAALPLLAQRIELFRSLLPKPNGGPPSAMTTHSQLRRLWYDLAGSPLPRQARVLVDTVGDQQILYGSDFCWTPAAGVSHQIAALDDDSTTDWRTLTTVNARRLLHPRQDVK